MEKRDLGLRIFYIINGSAQYILARSHSPFPVTILPPFSSLPDVRYGTVSFMSCLNTLSRSSPELFTEQDKDYTIYHMDPSESTNPSQPSIAVAMGSLSEGLKSNDSNILITGTLRTLSTGLNALEVVFALREVSNMPYLTDQKSCLTILLDQILEATSPIERLSHNLVAVFIHPTKPFSTYTGAHNTAD